MIDSYSFGQMRVNGRTYGKDLMIMPNGEVISPWWRQNGHELIIPDIETIIEARPSILVIGTGSSGLMRPEPGLAARLAAKGIKTVILPTKQAVNEFNALQGTESNLAACFHLTC